MTKETDSNSSSCSSAEQERKRKKMHKKLKKKEDKKLKRDKKKKKHKEKKLSKKEFGHNSIKGDDTEIKKIVSLTEHENGVNDGMALFGPALPPHLLNRSQNAGSSEPLVGPTIPMELLENLRKSKSQNMSDEDSGKKVQKETESEAENCQEFYGPLPVSNESEMTPAQLELEQRAIELKMAAIDGVNASTSNQNVREEWMLELPTVGLKGGLAALHNLKRTFHQGKEKPDFSDRSSWTKTPNSNEEKPNPRISREEQQMQAQALHERLRDAEQEAIAKEHKKKHKREESLVEIHNKKIRQEEKKKLKELKKSGAKPERRPFTRDVDLKLNKIDRNQTKQIVNKAKILNTKFSSGQSKYL